MRLITSDYEEKIWILRILILVYDPYDKEAYYIIYFIILVTLNTNIRWLKHLSNLRGCKQLSNLRGLKHLSNLRGLKHLSNLRGLRGLHSGQ